MILYLCQLILVVFNPKILLRFTSINVPAKILFCVFERSWHTRLPERVGESLPSHIWWIYNRQEHLYLAFDSERREGISTPAAFQNLGTHGVQGFQVPGFECLMQGLQHPYVLKLCPGLRYRTERPTLLVTAITHQSLANISPWVPTIL